MSETGTRPYRKRKRAESEAETRRRITEAAVELHGTVGPANTKVTDVAKLAGVSRMTVYKHFPTERDLFAACSTHWSAENPFPNPSEWNAIADPVERLMAGLEALYGWYRLNQAMLSNVLRDSQRLETLGELMDQVWSPFMEELVSALTSGWDSQADQGDALLRVALDFGTWRILTRSGLDDDGAARLMARTVSRAPGAPAG